MHIYQLYTSSNNRETFKLYTQLVDLDKLLKIAEKFEDHWYRMEPSLCKKIVHFSEESAEIQQASIAAQYGLPPNIYPCEQCSDVLKLDVYHVGYGYDAAKLNKRARRHRKQASSHRRKRASRRKRAKASDDQFED